MNWEEERLLYKVSKMYYDSNLTQSQISKELGIYRTTVGRMLKKARQKGIVKIEIQSTLNNQFELEDKIAKYFDLKEVIIVAPDPMENNSLQSKTGRACAELLNRIIKNDDVIGLAWGTTLGSMVDYLGELTPKEIDCVPLVGGPGEMAVEHHVNTIAYKLAQSFNGRPHFIDAAAIYESEATTQEILNSGYMKKTIELWDNLSVAIVGIGAKVSSSNMVWSGFLGEKEQKELREHDAIGDICSRFYTFEGESIESPISNRTIAIDLERLKTLRYSIGVAYSATKSDSIIAALNGKFINTLITDEATALEIEKKINGGL